MQWIDACVELHGTGATLDGRRGTVVNYTDKSIDIKLDDATHTVEMRHACCVFCLGVPLECRLKVRCDKLSTGAIHEAVSQVDADKFYVLYMGELDGWQHFVRVRLHYFEMMMKTISVADREPLARIYIGAYSQTDPSAKIRFGNMTTEMGPAPAYVDIDSALMQQLSMSSFQLLEDKAQLNVDQEVQRVQIKNDTAE